MAPDHPLQYIPFSARRRPNDAQAAALGISVAELIRRAVREQLPALGEGAWMKYAGFVETGDPHSSQSIDELVYGAKD
jgi:hypothetical protein